MAKRSYKSPGRIASREETRRRIVAAAETVLAEAGWAGFSLEAVGAAAGVTRLTVYNHFGARRSLLEAIFDANARRAGFERIAEAMGGRDPHAALDAVVAIFCAFWQSGSAPLRGIAAEAMADPEFAEALAARNQRRRQLLGALVARMDLPPAHRGQLTETLFALTSHGFYAELAALSPPEKTGAVTMLVRAAVAAAGTKKPGDSFETPG